MNLLFLLYSFYIPSITFSQVETLINKSGISTLFLDSSMLNEEGFVFDKSLICNLKTIQITKNEKLNLCLLSIENNKGETRAEFCNIICIENESFELELENLIDSKYLVYDYFFTNHFKIDLCGDELSFYYFDKKNGCNKLFLRIK